MYRDPYTAARDGDIEFLTELVENQGYNVNSCKWSGWTLLHRAAEQGHTQICEMLVDNGAKLNLKTTWGWHTATHLAIGNGWKETATFLIEAGADGNIKNKDGHTPSEYAHVKGYRDLARYFNGIVERIKEAKEAVIKHRRMKERAALNEEKKKKLDAINAANNAIASN